jgi:hypothetical protein
MVRMMEFTNAKDNTAPNSLLPKHRMVDYDLRWESQHVMCYPNTPQGGRSVRDRGQVKGIRSRVRTALRTKAEVVGVKVGAALRIQLARSPCTLG